MAIHLSLLANMGLMWVIMVGVSAAGFLLGLRFEGPPATDRLWFELPGAAIPIV